MRRLHARAVLAAALALSPGWVFGANYDESVSGDLSSVPAVPSVWGLDVGAKEEVYELVRAVTAEGVAVILTSDTLEETIGLSHTVLVMPDGEITHRTSASPGAKPRQVDLIGHMV